MWRGHVVNGSRCWRVFSLFQHAAYCTSINCHVLLQIQCRSFLARNLPIPLRLYIHSTGARGGVVVKVLRYKPAVHGFDSRWCHWNFSVT